MICDTNSIAELPENLFSFTPQIATVCFGQNVINRIDPNTIAEGVDNLKVIRLHRNLITTLHENLFAKVTMLETLWLQGNKIVGFHCNILSFSNRMKFYVGHYDFFVKNGKPTVWLQSNPLEDKKLDCLKSSLLFKNETEQKSAGIDAMKNNSTTNEETTKDYTNNYS